MLLYRGSSLGSLIDMPKRERDLTELIDEALTMSPEEKMKRVKKAIRVFAERRKKAS